MTNQTIVNRIGVGVRVTILVPGGLNLDGTRDYVRRTGSAVMRGPDGWMLNLGGRYGTPGIATAENIIAIKPKHSRVTRSPETLNVDCVGGTEIEKAH